MGTTNLGRIGNGGNKPAKAELTILYNQGSEQYQVEQMLAPDEQMLVDFGKLIRNQVPDKNGHVLPPDLTSGAYRIRDLEHNPLGALYEGKVIVDKTYGHAAYGCGVCCGPDAPTMAFDPLAVSIDDYADQYVQALNSCGGGVQDFTDDFSTWWTGNTAIATANRNSIHGVAAGTTNHYAESDPMYWGIRKAFNSCPVSRPQTTAGTKVKPTITGSNTVWWFNSQNPDSSSYPISATLTSSAGASTTWSVTQADTKVTLSSTSGASITVTSTGSHFSASSGDISVTATANKVPLTPFTMSAKTPWKLVSRGAPQTACFTSPETYTSTVSYDLHDNLDVVMSSNVDWNEVLGSQTPENGSNWGCCVASSSGGTDPVQDMIAPPELNATPAPSPKPTCSGANSGATRYRSIPQNTSVGTVKNGAGVHVQSDTLGYYIDHGQHDSIQIPAQPAQ